MVQRRYDGYEVDRSDVTFETLAADVGVKFNNVKSRPTSNGSNEWDASMKSVSQKMQIMALTTKVKQLEAEKSNNADSNSAGKKPSVVKSTLKKMCSAPILTLRAYGRRPRLFPWGGGGLVGGPKRGNLGAMGRTAVRSPGGQLRSVRRFFF